MALTREIPVYLFTGFLDAGKTTFIQETLEDPRFNDGQKTLILLCEEGEVEYDLSRFPTKNCVLVTLEDEADLNESYLAKLERKEEFAKVVVEYNGMWAMNKLFEAMPPNWIIYQEMCFMDARTILTFNANMRNLVFDKLQTAESVIFNHFTHVMDKMSYHKLVRTVNRRNNIIYEYGPNDVELDNIEDPLPFDINAPIIEIEDKDYAIWYADMTENESKYYDKTIHVRGRSLLGGGLKDGEFVLGRHIMACCAEDVQFGGLVAKYKDAQKLKHGGWVDMTATIRNEYNAMYKSKGPVYHVISVTQIPPIENEVATFY